MPVVLDKRAQSIWLNPNTSVKEAIALLKPSSSLELELYPVSKKVNSSLYLSSAIISFAATLASPDSSIEYVVKRAPEPIAEATLVLINSSTKTSLNQC
ncbi:MAG: SOS response-associated peptidase family protein [Tatlockia sp.]|nr:SOS response-associated peptidase family protein [Tatlockia sp.]